MRRNEYFENLAMFGREVADLRLFEEKQRRKHKERQIAKKQKKEVRKKLKQTRMFG